jgi:hypothetical protein
MGARGSAWQLVCLGFLSVALPAALGIVANWKPPNKTEWRKRTIYQVCAVNLGCSNLQRCTAHRPQLDCGLEHASWRRSVGACKSDHLNHLFKVDAFSCCSLQLLTDRFDTGNPHAKPCPDLETYCGGKWKGSYSGRQLAGCHLGWL